VVYEKRKKWGAAWVLSFGQNFGKARILIILFSEMLKISKIKFYEGNSISQNWREKPHAHQPFFWCEILYKWENKHAFCSTYPFYGKFLKNIQHISTKFHIFWNLAKFSHKEGICYKNVFIFSFVQIFTPQEVGGHRVSFFNFVILKI